MTVTVLLQSLMVLLQSGIIFIVSGSAFQTKKTLFLTAEPSKLRLEDLVEEVGAASEGAHDDEEVGGDHQNLHKVDHDNADRPVCLSILPSCFLKSVGIAGGWC